MLRLSTALDRSQQLALPIRLRPAQPPPGAPNEITFLTNLAASARGEIVLIDAQTAPLDE
jgi:hypothetical protein